MNPQPLLDLHINASSARTACEAETACTPLFVRSQTENMESKLQQRQNMWGI
jgi:hypothetical protein